MKNNKKFEPLLMGFLSSVLIGVLAFLTYETSAGIWLTFSFGSTVLVILVFYNTDFARPKNVFFGHLISILVGVLFSELFSLSVFSLSFSVGLAVTLMVYLKVVHPPAAGNPIIAIMGNVGYEYIFFPIISGTLLLILITIFVNRVILKRNYPFF